MRTYEIAIRYPSYFGRVYVTAGPTGLEVNFESGIDGIGELDEDGQAMNRPVPRMDALVMMEGMFNHKSTWVSSQARYVHRRLKLLGPALLRWLSSEDTFVTESFVEDERGEWKRGHPEPSTSFYELWERYGGSQHEGRAEGAARVRDLKDELGLR